MEPRPDLLGGRGPDFLGRLAAWLDDARTEGSAAGRTREAFLRRSAGEDSTVTGVLLDLAERGGLVLVTVAGGRRHRGELRAVGSDVCALRTPEGREALLATSGISSVRPEGRGPDVVGDRDPGAAGPLGLAEALGVLAEDRPRVLVLTFGDTQGVAGELRGVGRDVLVLRLDGADRATAYVPIANIVEVTLG